MTRTSAALGMLLAAAGLGACATAGSSWIAEPLPGSGSDGESLAAGTAPGHERSRRPVPLPVQHRVIGGGAPEEESEVAEEEPPGGAPVRARPGKIEGKVLGTFRNTYYDFPSEGDYDGAKVSLKNAKCKTIDEVPRGFFEAVCVQGSGTLATGATVSFAKRDCDCAEVCPRTGQKICFDELDRARFPWGRGAAGLPITPLITVAMDTSVVPIGTPIYIPEYDGVPRDESGTSFHDGCFVVQDRGMKVTGQHVDIFTGYSGITKLWNRLVPSNKGVTVVLDSPRCARAEPDPASLNPAPEHKDRPKRGTRH